MEADNWIKKEEEAYIEDCKWYMCYHCKTEWEDFHLLKRHIKMFHCIGMLSKADLRFLYNCSHCSFKTDSLDDFELHITNHGDSIVLDYTIEPEELMCQLCDYIPKNDEELGIHMGLHSADEMTFHCPRFNLTSPELPYEAQFRKFLPYSCENCDFASPFPSVLRNHIRIKHTKERPFQCSHCPFKSSFPGALKSHITSVHDKKKLFQCPYCEVALTRSHTLRDHIAAVHSDERPFSCPYCNYAAAVSAYLKAHIKAKHTNDKPYKCEYCPYSSVRSNTLQGHIRTRHTNEKPHRCPMCPYASVRPSFLREHIRAKHTNERPFVCPHCPYSTVRSANLKSHMQTHLKLPKVSAV